MLRKCLFSCTTIILCSLAAGSDESMNNDANDTLEGLWLPATAELGGKEFPEAVRKTIKLEVKGDQYTVTVGNSTDRGSCKLDPAAKPKQLDITGTEGPNKGKTIPAIYERNGDRLRVCYDLGGKNRPEEFKTAAGTQLFLVAYELQKK